MDPITKYLNNIAYKFPKGYPDINDSKDMELLNEMIKGFIKEDEDKITKKILLI